VVAEAPDGVKRLRELVLQLAVRGKLVPQDPGDEPVRRYLREVVRFSRTPAMACGAADGHPLPRLRQARCLSICRLGGRGQESTTPGVYINGLAFKPSQWKSVGLPIIRIQNLSDPAKEFNYAQGQFEEDVVVEDGDLLVSWSATLDTFIWNRGRAVLNQHIFRVRPCLESFRRDFLFWLLKQAIRDMAASDHAHGLVMKHINRGPFLAHVIALPPLAEQHRIVARVDELMGLLDRLEAARNGRDGTREAARDAALAALRNASTPEDVEVAWQRVAEGMDDLFTEPADVNPLRQAVLQLAVRGKLVPQDPEDEPASVLLERIAAEKALLVKEGHIRKTEALPPASGDDVPFEVPAGWAWTRLDELVDPERPVSYGVLVPGPDVQGGVPLVRVADLHPASPPERPEKAISEAVAAEYQRVVLRGDEVLIGVVGSIGKVGVAHPNWRGAVVARAVARFGVVADISRTFVVTMLLASSAQNFFQQAARTMAQPTLNVGLLRRLPVPTPPLAEQHRIVAKVDELMGLLDRLEQRLCTQLDLHDAFAAAVVHHLEG
jgi:type I restriction enzyme S subunit